MRREGGEGERGGEKGEREDHNSYYLLLECKTNFCNRSICITSCSATSFVLLSYVYILSASRFDTLIQVITNVENNDKNANCL